MSMDDSPQFLPNLNDLSQKAQNIYGSLPEEYRKENEGKYIAIELDNGEHFLGETKEEAVEKAKQKYPTKIVFVRRIGEIEKISYHSSLQFAETGFSNARLL